MGKLSICILDDKIPVSKFTDIEVEETSMIDSNIINHYLKTEANWSEDTDLMAFCKTVSANKAEYQVSGFKSHNFYFNYVDDNIYTPDIIIFDWDMDDAGNNPEANLLDILKNTYALVGVFTTADTEGQISGILEKHEFKVYSHNLFLIKKNDENSHIELEKQINSRIKHYSFDKGKEIKKKSLQALDVVLSNLGTISYDQFVSLFGHPTAAGGREIYGVDYCDIIMEKTKSSLINKIDNLETTIVEDIKDFNLLRKIWHFRLYNSPKDDLVRKGDIILKTGETNEQLYLVISSDCHLKEFWAKNLGYLTLLPLHRVENQKYISKLLRRNKVKVTKFDSLINSLTSPVDGISVLPGLIVNEEIFEDYVFISRSVFSINIELLEGVLQNTPLKYSQITNYSGDKRVRVAEPFLTPLIQFIVDNITGYGVADFSPNLKKTIASNLKTLLEDEKAS